MWHPILKWNTKRLYVKKELRESYIADLQAGLAASRAKEKRALAAQLKKEADGIDASIKAYEEKQDKGFWACENGHEVEGQSPAEIKSDERQCELCKRPMSWNKTELMTGQERYEAKKEREEAEKIALSKRQEAKQEEDQAEASEGTVKHFRRMAAASHETAERLRRI